MRKTLTVLTVVLSAASLAACDRFFGRETAAAEKPPVPATSTETAATTPPVVEGTAMAATPAPTAPATPAPAPATK